MNNEGIGLGLTIVRQIVEKAAGIITAHSDGPGKGSQFTFSMQMAKLDASEDISEDNAQSEEEKVARISSIEKGIVSMQS